MIVFSILRLNRSSEVKNASTTPNSFWSSMGNPYSLLNFGGDTDKFDDYIESFGLYDELGNAWNMGFYPIPDYDFKKLSGSYAQKPRDDR